MTVLKAAAYTVPALLIMAAGPLTAGPEAPVQEIIEGRAVWRGEADVEGLVIVRTGGELEIEPGTVVRFRPLDVDGDGIGDSELRIEGRLRVSGTGERPVVFTSAARDPAPADWKYVMINHAEGVEVHNAVFEYAYSGVQIHYTRGSFRGIVSRRNVDGFRFSTAPVTLTGSILVGNENGIRFEERGAGATITGNLIARNRVGLFAVTKCRGRTRFSDNVFEDNTGYNVKMGDRQADDLPLAGNWWGTADGSAVSDTFFDGRLEKELGTVIHEPVLVQRPAIMDGLPEFSERWLDR